MVDSRQQNQTIGSVKKPGTYEKTKVISGVVGGGGGISYPVSKPTQSSSNTSQPQSPASTPQSSNKLAEVLKPPTTPLTPYLPKATYSTGYNVISTPSSSTKSTSSTRSSTQNKVVTLGVGTSSNIFDSSFKPKPNVQSNIKKSDSQESRYATAYYQTSSESYYIGSGGSISPFERNQPPPLSRYEANAMPKTFLGKVKNWWETRQSPISDPVEEKTKFKVYPTGTSLNVFESTYKRDNFIPSIVPEKTGKEISKEQFILYDLGTPTEFKIDYLKKDIDKKYTQKQQDYIKLQEKRSQDIFQQTQSNINTGKDFQREKALYDLKITQLNEDISKYNTNINKDYESEFQIKSENLIKKDIGRLQEYRETRELGRKQVQLEPILETTALITLPASAGLKALQVSSGVLGAFGTKDIIQGTYRDDKMQIAEGLLKVGFAGSIVTSKAFAESLQMQSAEKSLKGLSKQNFIGFESRQLGVIDNSKVIGSRGYDSFTQTIKSSGDVVKMGKNQFIMPEGKLMVETKGYVPSRSGLFGYGSESPPKIYYSTQGYDIGTKGFSYNIGESSKNFLNIGSGSLIKKFETSAFVDLKSSIKEVLIPENTIKLYHATKTSNVKNILDEGLVTGKSSGVVGNNNKIFTALSKKTAEGYQTMMGGKDKATILEIYAPKEKVFQQISKEGIGTIGQVKFDSIPKDWIRISGQPTFEKSLSFDKGQLSSQLKSNFKLFEGQEYTKSGLIGVTRDLGNNFFVSRTGTISSIKPEKQIYYNEQGIKEDLFGVNINANLKDYVLTKTSKRPSTTKTFDIIESKGSDLGLKQFKKSISISPKLSSQTIEKGLIQEFKSEFKPSIITKPSTNFQQLTKTSSLGITKSSDKTSNVYATTIQKPETKFTSPSFSSSSLSSSFDKDSSFNTSFTGSSMKGSTTRPAISPTQSIFQSPALSTSTVSKTDLSNKQLQKQSFSSNFNMPPISTTSFNFNDPYIPFIPPLFSFGGEGVSKSSKRKKKKKGLVSTSLTSEVFGLSGKFPKSSIYGLTPFQFRTKPSYSKKKKKK